MPAKVEAALLTTRNNHVLKELRLETAQMGQGLDEAFLNGVQGVRLVAQQPIATR